ncbi:MAG: YegP family protein [Lachnospiraceae bacterium]|nr:YegP family protein [Lachnospiraceae bacterium]
MGKFVIKKTSAGTKFDLKSGNGEIIASSQVYASEAACKKGIASVQKNCTSKIENQTKAGFAVEKNPKYEVYKDKKGEFRFRLKATNGHIIATSEGYTSEANCLKGIESVKKNAPDAKIEEAK